MGETKEFSPDFFCVKMQAISCDCCKKNNIASAIFEKDNVEFVVCVECLKEAFDYANHLYDD